MSKFEGIIVPMMTPFDHDGSIREGALKEFVDYLIDGGVHGLFPCSSIGEFTSMSIGERKKVIEITDNQAGGRVPIIPGAGGNALSTTEEMLSFVDNLGVDGVVVVTPYYLKPDQQGLKEYFSRAAVSTDLPLFLYQIPMATGVEMSADTVVGLSEEHSNIVGMKDSSGDLSRLLEIKRRAPEDFLIFQGFDTFLLPTLLFGGAGGMVGTPNVLPGPAVNVYEHMKEGDTEAAREIQVKSVNPLFEVSMNHGVFPAGFKAVARELGVDLGVTRCPIRSLTEEEEGSLQRRLREIELE